MPPITLKHLAIGAVALIVLAVGWRYRNAEAVQRIINPPSHKPLAIEFDNGTVREPPMPASGAAADLNQGLKKCRRGETVVASPRVNIDLAMTMDASASVMMALRMGGVVGGPGFG